MTDVHLNPVLFKYPALGMVSAVMVLSLLALTVLRWRSVNRLRAMGRAAEFGDPPRFLFARDMLVVRLFAFTDRVKPADRRLFVSYFVAEMSFALSLIIAIFMSASI